MKANSAIDTQTTKRSRRGRVMAASVAAVALLGLSACTSDPGPKRVAQDIIKAEAILNPNLDEECLLAELEKFSNSELKDIDADLQADNSDRNAAGAAALTAYEFSLSSCV